MMGWEGDIGLYAGGHGPVDKEHTTMQERERIS